MLERKASQAQIGPAKEGYCSPIPMSELKQCDTQHVYSLTQQEIVLQWNASNGLLSKLH